MSVFATRAHITKQSDQTIKENNSNHHGVVRGRRCYRWLTPSARKTAVEKEPVRSIHSASHLIHAGYACSELLENDLDLAFPEIY